MSKTVKTLKQVCSCENCGNEAEMIITCTLEDDHSHAEAAPADNAQESQEQTQRVKGSSTCTQCGNEADMWVDL
ncbi:MAG: hypothetical protein JRI75_03300 [Deltaproteobacteria bacterium]|nr:hypothetical protein [Deltaproteobacteria bacterium]